MFLPVTLTVCTGGAGWPVCGQAEAVSVDQGVWPRLYPSVYQAGGAGAGVGFPPCQAVGSEGLPAPVGPGQAPALQTLLREKAHREQYIPHNMAHYFKINDDSSVTTGRHILNSTPKSEISG